MYSGLRLRALATGKKIELSILDAQVGGAVILGPGYRSTFLLFMRLVAAALWESCSSLTDFLLRPLKTPLQQYC